MIPASLEYFQPETTCIHLDMQSLFQFGGFFSLLAIIVAAEASSADDWQLASSALDLNEPDGDWTFANPFAEGDAVNSDIFQSYDTSNLDIGLFTDDPHDELLADVPYADCSSPDLAIKRRLGRRNALCSSSSTGISGTPHFGVAGSISDPTEFDQFHCPTSSILIKSLIVCSSPEPQNTVLSLTFYTLYQSHRGKQQPSSLFEA